MRIALTTAAAILMLGACSTPGERLTYNQELARLEADCQARDGTLQQLRLPSRDPGTDYACRIRSATRTE